MTPKEKAEELLNKFFNYCSYEWYEGEKGHKENMKQCALIAVDEILWEIIKYADNSREYVVENSKYWEEVKQEIEKL